MLTAFLVVLTALFFWQFLGYPLFMALVQRRNKRLQAVKDYSYQPDISVIVPAFNEEKVIGRRIENLLSLEYPPERFEIIVVDSGSTDRTAETAGSYVQASPKVTVLEEGERKGKASAINLGKAAARAKIVLVTDANTVFDAGVLKEIAPYFCDAQTGAVGGRFVLSNTENRLVRASSFYWLIDSLERRGESALDSACLFHGEINAWRKDIVDADTGSLAEDLDMAVRVRRKGYKIAYEPAATAREAGPDTGREQIIQKKRAVIGTIQALFKNRGYLWLPRDRYSGIIFPSHKTLPLLSPFLLLGLLAVVVTLLARGHFLTVIAWILSTIALFLLLFIMLRRELAAMDSGSSGSIAPPELPGILSYVLLHEYIILLAWKDYLLKNYSVKWEKAESTRI